MKALTISLKKIALLMTCLLTCCLFAACGDDEDDEPGTNTSKYSLTMTYKAYEVRNNNWYYEATIKTNANPQDVIVMGVKLQETGTTVVSWHEAGGATKQAKCVFGPLKKRTSYYVWPYMNVDGQRIEGSKATIRMR